MGQTAVDRMLESFGRYVVLSHEEQLETGRLIRRWLDWQGGADAAPAGVRRAGMRAKRRMIETNMRLVVSVARKYQNLGLPLEDLVQEGAIGLSRAAELYDPSRGYAFSTYSYWWIRQSITRALSNFNSPIRIPSNISDKLRNVQTYLLGRNPLEAAPTDEQICKDLKLSAAQLELLRLAAQRRHVASLDRPVGDRLSGLWESVPCPRSIDHEPLESIEDSVHIELLQRLMPHLTDKERQVLEHIWIYGFSQSATAQEMGLSRERVRQLDINARRKLQNWIHLQGQGAFDDRLPAPQPEWSDPDEETEQLDLVVVERTKVQHQPRRLYRRQNHDPDPDQQELIEMNWGPAKDTAGADPCPAHPPRQANTEVAALVGGNGRLSSN